MCHYQICTLKGSLVGCWADELHGVGILTPIRCLLLCSDQGGNSGHLKRLSRDGHSHWHWDLLLGWTWGREQ